MYKYPKWSKQEDLDCSSNFKELSDGHLNWLMKNNMIKNPILFNLLFGLLYPILKLSWIPIGRLSGHFFSLSIKSNFIQT